ncbi:hypothetical protein ACPOL_3946 [Acidisarcina polymorpha]|uniref:DinB-like domain-containing protein n=1 Tax=Acidisarcina polymorpha TaxID=2211140 RepID=A0A2Z5G3L9_9BACT|nr:bacillithiol transferase BstA [Acidisarcina polymorpha]AXC13225.1 hypothetical protein ACPOL_3946 [Acidisarcina polymorpha]
MSGTPALDASDFKLRYPIGAYEASSNRTDEERTEAIAVLEALPARLQDAVGNLSDSQLETPYRDGGWTVRQLVHHVADSHTNAYVRFRMALTESWPTIKPYDEARWAELSDARSLPVHVSLALLDSLHQRWVFLLRSLDAESWKHGYVHPEMGRESLDQVVAHYSWHSRHHTAHVLELKKRLGW